MLSRVELLIWVAAVLILPVVMWWTQKGSKDQRFARLTTTVRLDFLLVVIVLSMLLVIMMGLSCGG